MYKLEGDNSPLGDFTTRPRVITISVMAIVIGVIGAYIALALLQLIGLFTKPFALTIRLFANMVAGHIVIFFLIALTLFITVWVWPLSVAFALGIFLLELFVALVQAYIFTMLSALFIGMTQHAH